MSAQTPPLVIGTHGAVAAVDPTTGEVLWRTELRGGGFLAPTKWQDVTVLVKGDVIFAGSFGHLFCLDARNGNVLWHNELKGFGLDDISLAMDGIAVQVVTRTTSGAGSSS